MTRVRDTTALAGLEGRWTLQILGQLSCEGRRFSDLRAALPGLSANILTVRLRELEESGLVNRAPQPPNGERSLYELGANTRELEASARQTGEMDIRDVPLTPKDSAR